MKTVTTGAAQEWMRIIITPVEAPAGGAAPLHDSPGLPEGLAVWLLVLQKAALGPIDSSRTRSTCPSKGQSKLLPGSPFQTQITPPQEMGAEDDETKPLTAAGTKTTFKITCGKNQN